MLILLGRQWWAYLYHLSIEERGEVVEALYRGGHITNWQLWEVLSNHQSPIPHAAAAEIYQDLGFQPHAGYPLTEEV
jgi:hypothetical protein